MTRRKKQLLSAHLAGILVLLAGLIAAVGHSEAQTGAFGDGRAETGARLFRAMLAADTDLDRKADPDGALTLLVVHAGDAERGAALREVVARRDARRMPEPIKTRPVRVDVVPLDQVDGRTAAGILIAEPLGSDPLARLILIAAEKHIILYSPFEGDVEKGVVGGLSIEAQVRPFVNTEALRASEIRLKEFFLKVAKAYP